MLGPSWMDPIVSFMTDVVLSSKAKKVEKVQSTSAWFCLSKDKTLYQWSFKGPYLLCLHLGDVEGRLTELHGGICRSHMGGWSLAHQAMTRGFWWPNMQRDAAKYVKKCDQCQKDSPYPPVGREPKPDLQPVALRPIGVKHRGVFSLGHW